MKKNILIIVLFSIKSWSQIPNISYPSGTHSFPVGVIINSLPIYNSGGAIPQSIAGQVSTRATIGSPLGIALDNSGNIYVSSNGGHKIYSIAAGATSGIVIAGSGSMGGADGVANSATFYQPYGVAVGLSGKTYVASNSRIRMISYTGGIAYVSTLAGSTTSGSTDETGSAASFYSPVGICTDGLGNIYVADTFNSKIRKVTPAGVVTTIAGNGNSGATDGPASSATFYGPTGIAIDSQGNLYVADQGNNKIRKIATTGIVSTIAGNGSMGSTDGIGSLASFKHPSSLTIDNANNIYVSDQENNKIRRIDSSGNVSTLAGTGIAGAVDGSSNLASFNNPWGLVVDTSYNVYVADLSNSKIRKITTLGFSISPNLPSGLTLGTNGIISGNPTVATPATTYTITACNTSGCSSTTIIIATSSLATELFNQQDFKIYPNPTKDFLHIDLKNELSGKIIDLTGKNLMNVNTKYIDVSSLSAGIYLLDIVSDDKHYVSKIVKE